jgi:hypothetical protein
MPSSIPAVIAAVTTLVGNELSGVQVVDGEIGTYIAAEQFTFGEITGTDVPATLAGNGPQAFTESYDLNCRARTYAGGDDLDARRTRGLAMKDAIRDGLAADQSLGGVVNQAYLSQYAMRVGFDTDGVACEVDLVIHVQNYQQ